MYRATPITCSTRSRLAITGAIASTSAPAATRTLASCLGETSSGRRRHTDAADAN